MESLQVPQGAFLLDRYPVVANDPLRAWDAADRYVLEHLDTHAPASPSRTIESVNDTILVVNDSFGVLTTALASRPIWSLSDSYLSLAGGRHNLVKHGIAATQVHWLNSFDSVPDRLDVVVIKVPKNLSLLEDQLRRIRPALHADTLVIGAAMAKHIHSSTLDVFDRCVGPTRTSIAQSKARLIFSDVDTHRHLEPPSWPRSFSCPPGDHEVFSHAGVFAGESLDVGTRFFLETLPKRTRVNHIVDLGCGNGVVGMIAATRDPSATITFIDESFRAVKSAEDTFRANFGPDRDAHFLVGNNFSDLCPGSPSIEPESVDLVLNNPPFHVDRSIGDAVAWQMFVESRLMLRPDGEMWVVGNRHLAYHAKLKRVFGNCETMASNAKFVVLRSIKVS
ncbi:MAG: methyltransferase [Actinomycetes bacterium]